MSNFILGHNFIWVTLLTWADNMTGNNMDNFNLLTWVGLGWVGLGWVWLGWVVMVLVGPGSNFSSHGPW